MVLQPLRTCLLILCCCMLGNCVLSKSRVSKRLKDIKGDLCKRPWKIQAIEWTYWADEGPSWLRVLDFLWWPGTGKIGPLNFGKGYMYCINDVRFHYSLVIYSYGVRNIWRWMMLFKKYEQSSTVNDCEYGQHILRSHRNSLRLSNSNEGCWRTTQSNLITMLWKNLSISSL